MPLNTSGLAAYIALSASLFSASLVHAAEPELPIESHLARGVFQLAVINRDETRLLTATSNLAQLWDLKSGTMLQQYKGHEAHIHSICFSPNEQLVLTGAGKSVEHGPNDPSARLWDVSTGNVVKTFTTVGQDLVDEIGESSSYFVSTARYAPSSRQILTVMNSCNSYPDAAVLWNVDKMNIDFVLPHIDTTSGTKVIAAPVQFSPDGDWLSGLAKESSQVVIWNAGTGDVRWRFSSTDDAKQNKCRFELINWSQSGKYLLAVLSDQTVRVWDVSSGTAVQRLQGHSERIYVAHFLANETGILTASEDRTVRQWDLQSGAQLQRWEYQGPVQQLSVSPDGQRLLTRTMQIDPNMSHNHWFGEIRDLNGESIRKWELPPMWIAENQPLNAYRSSIMSPSGSLVLTTVWIDGEVGVILIDAETGEVKRRY